MLKREDRERKIAEWLEHLEAWKSSGMSFSAYARAHGLALWAGYQWRSKLIRQGLWATEPGAKKRQTTRVGADSPRVPLHFARVRISTEPTPGPMTVRVQLCNGRRAEIEIAAVEHLGEVLCALERVP